MCFASRKLSDSARRQMRHAGSFQGLDSLLHIAAPFESEAREMRTSTSEHHLQGRKGERSRYVLWNVGHLACSRVAVHFSDRQPFEQHFAFQRLQYAGEQAN